jgi:hypothetical protein
MEVETSPVGAGSLAMVFPSPLFLDPQYLSHLFLTLLLFEVHR